jgi:oligopeptide transport system substrate-binding protein
MAIRFRQAKVAISALAVAAFVAPLFSTATAAQAKKVLNYDLGGEPASLDPQVASFANDIAAINGLFRGLLRYDEKGTPVASIAKEVPTVANGGVSADGLTYTYHLRNDWKWSDGNGVVMAKDFVYAFQRLVNPKTAGGYGSFLDGLLLNADTINNTDADKVDQAVLDKLGVKAVDDFTVQFTLVHPASYWNQVAAMWIGDAVRKDNVERSGDPSSGAWLDPANGPVVGSGPFTITKWDHNKTVVYSKNPNFAGSQAKLDEIDFALIQDSAVAFAGYKAGQLDVSGFPPVELDNVKADPTLSKQLLSYSNTCSFYLGMDNTSAPFNNIDVRKAFAHALDRDAYTKIVLNGLGTKWLSFLSPSIAGNDPKLGSDYDFNPDQAKKDLAKAGYPDGKGFPSVSYHYRAGAAAQRGADWYQAQFKKVLGITINEDPMDSAVLSNAESQPLNKLDGLYTLGWCADYLHPSDWLLPVFGANLPAGNGTNVSGYHDPAFEKLAAQADQTVDPDAALKLYQQAQQVLVDDVPVVFLEVSVSIQLVNPKVQNLKYFALDSGYPGAWFWEDVDISA